jgi:hypothetical protein
MREAAVESAPDTRATESTTAPLRTPMTLHDVHVMRNSPVPSASASDSPSAASAATMSANQLQKQLFERQLLELQSQYAYEQELQLRHREAARLAENAKLQFLMRNMPP